MSAPAAPDWAAIRHRYEETQDAVADICAQAGIEQRELAARRRREGWRRSMPRPFPPPRKSLPPPPPTSPDGAAVAVPDASVAPEPPTPPARPLPKRVLATPAARRRLLDRLVAAISMKLEQLERRMTDDLAAIEVGDATATDHERETRAIGALIDNLGKITEIDADLQRPADAKRGVALPVAGLADEAERCRRELADRLSRLVEAAARDA